MHAHRRREQQLCHRVEPPDVHKLVFQHILQGGFVPPVGFLRQQDHRVPHTEGERRGDERTLPDGDLSPQQMRLQPLPGKRLLHREGHLEFLPASSVGCSEKCSQKQHACQPDNRPHRHRLHSRRVRCSSCFGCHACRKITRQGRACRRAVCPGHSLRAALHQHINAAAEGHGERHQQPGQRHLPQHQKSPLGQAFQQQRPQNEDNQDHHRAGHAHLPKAHTNSLIPVRPRSASACEFALPKFCCCPEGLQTACRQSRRRPC